MSLNLKSCGNSDCISFRKNLPYNDFPCEECGCIKRIVSSDDFNNFSSKYSRIKCDWCETGNMEIIMQYKSNQYLGVCSDCYKKHQ